MYIRIEEKQVEKDSLDTNKAIVVQKNDMTKYNVVNNNGFVMIDGDWLNSNTTECAALYNTKTDKKSNEGVYVALDDIDQKEIPTFGVTLENNFNIQQFNIKRSEIAEGSYLHNVIDDIFKTSFFDADKTLNVCSKKISNEKISKIFESYKGVGFAAPLVLYVDKNFIRPYYHEIVAYIYELFQFDTIPVRVITYKDIKYVENIDDALYRKLKEIPKNDFFTQEDKINYAPYMIDNFSDKKKVINTYRGNKAVKAYDGAQCRVIDESFITEVIPYVFTEEYEALNSDLIQRISSHNYQDIVYYEDGKRSCDLPISESLYHYLLGYENVAESSFEGFDKLKLDKEIDFDPSLLALDTFDYIESNDSKIEEIAGDILTRFGGNCVCKMLSRDLIDMRCLPDVLSEKQKIKILA